MIVAMIESSTGVAIVDRIAAVPGSDVVFAASGDLGSFSGYERTDPRYMKLVNEIKDKTLAAGKILAGPAAWRGREGFLFFQGPSEGSLIGSGAKLALGEAPPAGRRGVATGEETKVERTSGSGARVARPASLPPLVIPYRARFR